MEKTKRYPKFKFSSRVVRRAIDLGRSLLRDKKTSERLTTCSVEIGEERWIFDDLDEFLTAYMDKDAEEMHLNIYWLDENSSLTVYVNPRKTLIGVRFPSRSNIEKVFSVFEEAPSDDRIPLPNDKAGSETTIFIGHGHNEQWQVLKSHLQDKHDINVVSYETGARAGHTIRDILESMTEESSLALLVLTGEDKTENGMRARQNVIHECGLFQGTLGFDKAILLVEEGVELASNFDGIQQLTFAKGRISEIFGDVIAIIRREFGPI